MKSLFSYKLFWVFLVIATLLLPSFGRSEVTKTILVLFMLFIDGYFAYQYQKQKNSETNEKYYTNIKKTNSPLTIEKKNNNPTGVKNEINPTKTVSINTNRIRSNYLRGDTSEYDDLLLNSWKVTLKLCRERNINLVEMSEHNSCCAECSKYQGRVYSIDGKDNRFPKLPDVALKTGQLHNGCRHSFHPFYYGVTSLLVDPKYDAVEYSNRPFIDEREPWEKAVYERNRAEAQFKLGNLNEAISILDNAVDDLLPCSDPGNKIDSSGEKLTELIIKLTEYMERRVYLWAKKELPDIVPKSFSSYNRMKVAKTKNWLKLVELANERGIDID